MIDIHNFNTFETKQYCKRRSYSAVKLHRTMYIWHQRMPTYDHTLAYADIRYEHPRHKSCTFLMDVR